MANARFYSSIAATTNLQVTAAPADTSIQVASSVGFPGSFPFTLSLDYGAANEELVDVTAGGPSIYTVTRAVDGTSASTHNAGAVVRHVSSARDFTESRTHEAAVSGVHGISGAFVDTTSVQTLTNKTLTAPVIAGGTISGAPTFTGTPVFNAGAALSGTFSGTPTFSGVVNLSAGATIAGGTLSGTFSGSPTYSGNVVFSASPLFSGSPNFTGVTTFTAATNFDGVINANAQLLARRTFATGATYRTSVTGDATDRFFIDAAGAHNWGNGTAAVDTNLYRKTANVLGTDDSLELGGYVIATGTGTFAVEEATSGVSAAAGWSISTTELRKTCGVVSINVAIERTGATLNASSSGSMGSVLMATLPAGYRPASSWNAFGATVTGDGRVRVLSDGTMTLDTWSSDGSITTGGIVRVTGTYIP